MKARLAFLLATWLVSVACWAQPARTGPAVIDSRDECTAMQGAWKPAGNGWRAACEVPWSQDDCLRLGGAWTRITKSSTGGRCFAGVSEWATALQCVDNGGTWGPPGSRMPACTFETAKAKLPPPKAQDAGKLCDSQQDCTYGCVYDGPPVKPRADVIGRCRATNIAGGCFSMVESGRLAGRICVN